MGVAFSFSFAVRTIVWRRSGGPADCHCRAAKPGIVTQAVSATPNEWRRSLVLTAPFLAPIRSIRAGGSSAGATGGTCATPGLARGKGTSPTAPAARKYAVQTSGTGCPALGTGTFTGIIG